MNIEPEKFLQWFIDRYGGEDNFRKDAVEYHKSGKSIYRASCIWRATRDWPHRVRCVDCSAWYETDEEFNRIEKNRYEL